MIRKFPGIPAFRFIGSAVLMIILAGVVAVNAQQASEQPQPSDQPQAQQPASQDSSSQEASPEETTPGRRVKPRDYKNWSFNVGGGASMPNGTTNKFVRGGGGIIAAGVAKNYSRFFGFRLDVQWDNLPLRTSALQAAQAPSANDHAYLVTLDPIINLHVTKDWGGYLIFGPTYLHRSGKLESSTAIPGSACNPFFTWWGHCYNSSLPINGHFLNASQNEFGYNFGGGITRKIRPNIDFYAEFRYIHGSHNGLTTDFRPITAGIRW